MRNLRGAFGLLCAALLSAGLVFLTSASRLDTAWLVPAGDVHVDYKALAQPDMKVCALTFDDGPDAKYTPQVAAILLHYHIPATFFVIGTRVGANPQVLRDLVDDGFEIGNHSQDHPQMPKLSAERQHDEIKQVQTALGKLGVTPHWFRPPYGAFNATTVSTASKLGLETVLWSVDPRDWSEPGVSRIQSRVLGAVRPGAVVLLHSTHGQTVQALPGIIEGLQKQGYHFVTMSQWALAVSGKLPEAAQADDVLPEKNAGAPPPGLQVEPDEAVQLPADDTQSAASSGAPAATPASVPQGGGALTVTNETVEPAPAAESAAAPPSLAAAAEGMALAVLANFTGPEQAQAIWQGSAGSKLHQWLSDLSKFGGVGQYLGQLNPGLAPTGGEEAANPAAAMAPAAPAPANPGPQVFPLSGDGPWGGAWQPAPGIALPDIVSDEKAMAANRFRPAPKYYLLRIGMDTDVDAWDGLHAFFGLARLDGMLVSDPATFASAPHDAPTPLASAPASQLAADAMVDLSLQGVPDILDRLRGGNGNIYLTVRPNTIDGYSGKALGDLGRGQQEFVLFRRLTQGLNYDAAPENDFAPTWPLPPGIRLARFFGPQCEVLALYASDVNNTPFNLPTPAHGYSVAQLDGQGRLALRPLVEATYVLGRSPLLLYRELH
jgi:peptidoglycan/xylan/chitin deacetylase (PgdA/CDA1 family)